VKVAAVGTIIGLHASFVVSRQGPEQESTELAGNLDQRRTLEGESVMDENRISGTSKNLGGKAQEIAGKAAGDTSLQLRGKANQAVGNVEDMYGQAKDAAADVAQSVQQGAQVADDMFRRTIEERPYTTAVAALAVGWLIGRMGRA